ncbi:glycosyltransferase family 2 protein [Acetanaerobacterium elongatum]|uniref:Glycosyltransferase involved in cell wall bisynthesis n=1 Tax=Acetanaerobacterium elongatum TaxID=258515 RepID=A0A1G9UG19_9FIRM|nr:glycosyltransferase family 2 protein [Acetanaerobacterium elongatum]SDM58846.1 Glycosyltransferase involved in cell wall bisynthesis [Acetanaerobacterium elongatum]
MTTLYIVVPCYNEQEVLPETSKRFLAKLKALIDGGKITDSSRILFVNDGSKDKTWDLIAQYHEQDCHFSGLKLSRNRGHQNALLAGLMTAKEHADCVVSLDADLQDDINAVDEMLAKFEEGCDIVYGVRSSRAKDTFFKRTTAVGFYKFMRALGANVLENHADYRLMSKRSLDALAEFSEVNLFLRGMVPLVGFKFATVSYVREERFAGESKYPLKKMLSFAFDGITSFSVKPLSIITSIGFIVFVVSILAAVYALVTFILGHAVSGWTSTIISLWFLGGVQLICLGVVGQYIGKIYNEVKRRPRYIIEDFLNQ